MVIVIRCIDLLLGLQEPQRTHFRGIKGAECSVAGSSRSGQSPQRIIGQPWSTRNIGGRSRTARNPKTSPHRYRASAYHLIGESNPEIKDLKKRSALIQVSNVKAQCGAVSPRYRVGTEREGFEPPIRLPVCRISSAVLSTTQPPLQNNNFNHLADLRGEQKPKIGHPIGTGGLYRLF
jgi:hypothetical protein